MRPLLTFATACLLVVAAHPGAAEITESADRPELSVRETEEGMKLNWSLEDQAVPGLLIEDVEIWRYVPIVSPLEHGIPLEGIGEWEHYDSGDGKSFSYVDTDPEADGSTFYFVRVLFQDGSVSMPSNPSSMDYPHCHWIILHVPPQTDFACLFPPPFVEPPTLEAS